ncbi:energy transducer TonB [uncultured Polaribacter sp.]|uniref:energy transducer TonB n=1 Tax=uncultured Polaribacter sp. TaxID=174711 RepID=UPI00261CBA2F|nr:energy transducer TonB [uncultured Polaribacter sp.]
MEVKKYPRKQLENFSKIFLQIGLALSLFTIYVLIEHKTHEHADVKSLGEVHMTDEMKEDIPIIKIPKMKPTQKKTLPPPTYDDIKVVEDDIKVNETILETTETNENEAVTNAVITTDNIFEVQEGEEIVEDVPFILIEDVPVFPGCKGNNKELKACFTKKITAYFASRFDVDLATELGLSEGKKRIFVVFKIDKTGIVTNIKARAPHPRLEKEVVEIISSLPKMQPGKQRGIPVTVSYSLPITFEVRQ